MFANLVNFSQFKPKIMKKLAGTLSQGDIFPELDQNLPELDQNLAELGQNFALSQGQNTQKKIPVYVPYRMSET